MNYNMKKILIMISGRGSNMEAIVRNINNGVLHGKCEILEVFSNVMDAPGLVVAEKFGIKTTTILSKKKKRKTYNSQLLEYLQKLNPDFIVLAGYMKVLDEMIIEAFPHRIINIHPADTAEHQGLHGYEWAWENKLPTTKVTVHYVDAGLDTGSVIAKREVDLKDCFSLEDVEKRGLTLEHKFYSECLNIVFSATSGK